MSSKWITIGMVIGVIICASVIIPRSTLKEDWHKEAIMHGCAEFYVDKDGKAQWRWK